MAAGWYAPREARAVARTPPPTPQTSWKPGNGAARKCVPGAPAWLARWHALTSPPALRRREGTTREHRGPGSLLLPHRDQVPQLVRVRSGGELPAPPARADPGHQSVPFP